MRKPITQLFNKTPYVVFDNMDSTYYTGLDTSLYVDDIFVEEFLQISWQESQQETPLTNWNSYEATLIHSGARIVAGRVAVNLKSPHYLKNLLSGLASFETRENPSVPKDKSKEFSSQLGRSSPSNINTTEKSSTRPLDNIYNRFYARIPEATHPVYSPEKEHTITVIFGEDDGVKKALYSPENEFQDFSITKHKIHPYPNPKGVKIVGVKFNEESYGVDDSGKPIVSLFSFIAKGTRPID